MRPSRSWPNREDPAKQPVPYLFFRGTCEEAMRAYARVFGSPEPEVMYARDAPEGETSGLENAVMHATLRVGDG